MEKLRSIFNFIYGYYLDYRYKVPPASALSFAYYMILSIIPIYISDQYVHYWLFLHRFFL